MMTNSVLLLIMMLPFTNLSDHLCLFLVLVVCVPVSQLGLETEQE
jgi:hypothetical protein